MCLGLWCALMTLDDAFAANVKRWRKRRGYTQSHLAGRCAGVSRETLANLESGRLLSASLRQVTALSEALELSPMVLLGLMEDRDAVRLDVARSFAREFTP